MNWLAGSGWVVRTRACSGQFIYPKKKIIDLEILGFLCFRFHEAEDTGNTQEDHGRHIVIEQRQRIGDRDRERDKDRGEDEHVPGESGLLLGDRRTHQPKARKQGGLDTGEGHVVAGGEENYIQRRDKAQETSDDPDDELLSHTLTVEGWVYKDADSVRKMQNAGTPKILPPAECCICAPMRGEMIKLLK